jgi:hypothetical protein
MESNINLKEIERKTFGYSNQDGLLELVMGVCMVAISTRLISRFLVFMMALAVILFGPILIALRKRYTYPRIGYVRLVPDKPKNVIGAILLITLIVIIVMALFFLLFADIGDFDLWMRWIPVWAGVVLAGMFSSLGSKSGCIRYYIFAIWSVIVGFVLSIIRFEAIETGTLLYFLVMGCMLIPWGLVTFIRFLSKHPKQTNEV